MNKILKNIIIINLVLVPAILVIALTFFYTAYKKFGSPTEYRQRREELMQAKQDSIRVLESVVSPEYLPDSTMVGLSRHTDILEETKEYENKISEVKSSLDSLEQKQQELEEKEESIIRRQSMLDALNDETFNNKISRLAKIYDTMKPQQSVPLFIPMNDTLAVFIINGMADRSSSRLLGAIAEKDIKKATRLNKLLSELGITK
ncbi:hypothetical protein ACFL1R_03340 [Candidatus Latescibacterota bacterium]